MFAVIYIDGNSMGEKLAACKSSSYDEGVKNLRRFSKNVNKYYVESPIGAIKGKNYTIRKVIGGGDEITLICPARDAFKIMRTYFDDLNMPGKAIDCSACAGISVFHAKAPFNVAYDIAEAACAEAKKQAHTDGGSWFCFYYCHAGVTKSFDKLHDAEQKKSSGKPYPYHPDALDRMERCGAMLNTAGRSNVKALGNAAQRGLTDYRLEVKRVNAYLKKDSPKFTGDSDERRLVYDMSEFFDLWFAKEENGNDQNA